MQAKIEVDRRGPIFTPEQFAKLGGGAIAYVRSMPSEEVTRLYPQAPEIEPGLTVFCLLGADGAPIVLADSEEGALANAWEKRSAHGEPALTSHGPRASGSQRMRAGRLRSAVCLLPATGLSGSMKMVDELYAICSVNDVAKRQAIGYVLAKPGPDGQTFPFPIVVTRHRGKFYAYVNRCPHQDSRLDFQPGQFLDTAAAPSSAASTAQSSTSPPAIASTAPAAARRWRSSKWWSTAATSASPACSSRKKTDWTASRTTKCRRSSSRRSEGRARGMRRRASCGRLAPC